MPQTDLISSHRLSRRGFIACSGASLLTGSLQAATAAPLPGADGLYDEPWLTKTSADLEKDFAAATGAKKNFAIAWEMRGCPWCKRLHIENFNRPSIASYLQDNFSLIQLNVQGSREIIDTGGAKLTEKALSYKYGIDSTPTIQFFIPNEAANRRELGRAGYMLPDDFLAMLHFIREKGYEKAPFAQWAKTHTYPS